MRTSISAGLFSILVIVASSLSAIAADALPSDAVIQQRIVGTWRLNWIAFQCTTTISTNGDYVANWSDRIREEGTIEIRNGVMVNTLKKTSGANQPVPMPHVSTNTIIRLTDHELFFRARNETQPLLWERAKQ